MDKLNAKIELWKKSLLDFGKRNQLFNFKETKRTTLKIVDKDMDSLYDEIVFKERLLTFSSAKNMAVKVDEEGEEIYESDNITEGDILSNRTFNEQQKTLASLRSKAKLSIEEQGVNTLFLAFGLLQWVEREDSKQMFQSPIILVPVSLSIESISAPYKIQLHEDEIVLNPTLAHKLENDFGIKLPEFDESEFPSRYLERLTKTICKQEGWNIVLEMNVALLSFLKINMYADLEKHKEKILNNKILSVIAGDDNRIELPIDCKNFDHDAKTRPIDTSQVMDADSSQQDAILLSKRGISFVLQGPPGTGKSQTITNIISEALADGKKVLFVSEKKAALQVVHKRLKDAGLADFCLAIHSHKASKKDILQQLYTSMTLNKIAITDEAILQLNQLQEKREKLNKYQQQLHTVVDPLHKTIFDVNGALAKLSDSPDRIFVIEDVNEITFDKLLHWKSLLNDYAGTIGQLTDDFVDNPWYNCNVPAVTHELRNDIDFHLTRLIPILDDLSKLCKDTIVSFSLPFSSSWNSIQDILIVLSISSDSPLFPQHWISNENLVILKDQTFICKDLFENIVNCRDAILEKYDASILKKIEGKELKVKIEENILSLKPLINKCLYNNDDCIVSQISNIHVKAKTLADEIGKIQNLQKKNECIFDSIESPMQAFDFPEYVKVLNCLKCNLKPTEYWFTSQNSVRQEIQGLIADATQEHNTVFSIKEAILNEYDKDLLTVDAGILLRKFRTEYNSIFSVFKSGYRKDMKMLRSYYKGTNKFSNLMAINVLEKVKQYRDSSDWFVEHSTKLCSILGDNYVSSYTDWERIIVDYKTFNTIFDSPIVTVTESLKEMLLNNSLPIIEIDSLLATIKSLDIDSILEEAQDLCIGINNRSDISLISTQINSIISHCLIFEETRVLFNSFSKNIESDLPIILSDLDSIAKIQIHKTEIENSVSQYEKLYGVYWKEYDTQWNDVLVAIDYAIRFKDLIEKYDLPETFSLQISSNLEAINRVEDQMNKIQGCYNAALEHFMWIAEKFDESENLSGQELYVVNSRFKGCIDNKALLDEWINFRSVREKCRKEGLASYLISIEEFGISANEIVNTFLKRFYRLWLDATMPTFEEVQSFRTKNHEELIREFQLLDKEQQIIARSRIRQRLVERIPDFNGPSNAYDETATLRRELSKQRRIMPLRKLFNAIPNLMTSLKPCFMMSPLSVSVFLEADNYEFDLVVFDEASQVCTENAIGAIMRGRQAIIVGDSKQLPPTNFFNSSLTDGDYDSEDEDTDDEAGAYESILDEASTALPNQSLLWHYRSKHEHLIAFSNTKIYHDRLITFPSNIEKAPGTGVEYIYVQDGVYERGGKKQNLKEAKKVCDLIFEHFQNTPNKSLGVVTFSEAQQLAIETEIRQRRLNNSRFEKFFEEEKDEPFFVKNLENVQGDERDTIIFSIGYAKDPHGVMYMNFGPLSKNGGYRRLNVAITRAKYNIKLVGSIRPVDIDLERTSSEGVRMLRAYIDFASRGSVAIEGEITASSDVNTESPFEESVYDFLAGNGYNVTTQVGCSAYRIDMAIRHPNYNSAYVLGIECDGASYHSSRTARERDRLRQSVLEDMGWSFYRIWSTDWIKDPKVQGELLLSAVTNAIENYSVDDIIPSESQESISQEQNYVKVLSPSIFNSSNDYGFVQYTESNPMAVCKSININSDGYELRLAIEYTIKVEQPIHKKLLYKRMAPFLGNEKVTTKIINAVDDSLSAIRYAKINDNDDVLTLKDFNGRIPVRIPANGEKPRDIELVPTPELKEAIKIIVSKSYGISRTGLITETARSLCYNRTGPRITGAINEAIDDLYREKVIKEIEEHITTY